MSSSSISTKNDKVPENTALTVSEHLDAVNFDDDADFIPSSNAIKFIEFIKMVNAGSPEENTTPILHYRMATAILGPSKLIANLLFRGSAKTTLSEYLILYIGTYGGLPGCEGLEEITYGSVLAAKVDDVIAIGKNIYGRWMGSPFLQKVIPTFNHTEINWILTNASGHELHVKAFGALGSIRGKRVVKHRPKFAIIDDILKDNEAYSAAMLSKISDTIYAGVFGGLHPKDYKVIWNGTPFNSKDLLFKAIESGAWDVNIYPVCEKFPCTREEFKGAWEDRFPYDVVMHKYSFLQASGFSSKFYSEFMLEITSEEDKLIKDSDIQWHNKEDIQKNRDRLNFYITTDFATTVGQSNDYSPINVWAYGDIGYGGRWYWVDGTYKKQRVNDSIDDVFKFAALYPITEVGIEASGQQGGFISWIKREMGLRKIFFSFAKGKTTNMYSVKNSEGIIPLANKFQRFLVNAVPLFKTSRISFPIENKDDPTVGSFLSEISGVTLQGLKSAHDDQLDNLSMLGELSINDNLFEDTTITTPELLPPNDSVFTAEEIWGMDPKESTLFV